MIKKTISILSIALLLLSCNNNDQKENFYLTGEIKNAPDQKIFLEELFFSDKDPEVLDTAEIKKGKFSIAAITTGEGLFRLRLANTNSGFIFINDKNNISFTADINNLSLQSVSFNSPANQLLKSFINDVDSQRKTLETLQTQVNQLKNQPSSDSLYKISSATLEQQNDAFKKYIIRYIDTTSDAVMAMFALGYTSSIDPALLVKPVGNLTKRFPGNQSIASIVTQFDQMMARYNKTPHEGGIAPDLNMPDTSGKPFALSMLRGKYVLVDFWASWCGPCRNENPNVVNAYNTFKDKNFTILGVSLDKDKAAWIKAIDADGLTWYHISDLKEWNTAAISLYAFEAIPYNVLVDPKGKIIAQNLRGNELENKLEEVLK